MSKLNVVLDLDNTLISSVDFNKRGKMKHAEGLQYFDMGTEYRIYTRPYLAEFLDFLFLNFNVSIWTAATEDYARFIMDNIVKNPNLKRHMYISNVCPFRHVHAFLHRKNCEQSMQTVNPHTPKDLRYMYRVMPTKFSKENTFIVDDHRDVILHNMGNVVDSKYFEVEAPGAAQDRHLVHLINYLKIVSNRHKRHGTLLLN